MLIYGVDKGFRFGAYSLEAGCRVSREVVGGLCTVFMLLSCMYSVQLLGGAGHVYRQDVHRI